MKTTDGERIVRVETQIIDLKAAVAEVRVDTKEIKQMLTDRFMQRNEVRAIIEELKHDFSEEIKGLKRKRWYENTLSAAAGIILAAVTYIFSHNFIK